MARGTRPAAACREECACTPASDSTHQADVTAQAQGCFSYVRHCTVSGSWPHLRRGGTAQPLAHMHQPVWQPAAALDSSKDGSRGVHAVTHRGCTIDTHPSPMRAAHTCLANMLLQNVPHEPPTKQAFAWPAPSMKQGQAHCTGEPRVTRHCTMAHCALGAYMSTQASHLLAAR
jgi:hypothetical protein